MVANDVQRPYNRGMAILTRDFYTNDPMCAARGLLGAYLCRRRATGEIIRARICEIELYDECERACHAFGGKCTARNDAMFMDGGHAYVYLCYGLHNMLNIVLGRRGRAVAALIRAVELPGCDGPGKVCRAFQITRADNKLDLTASPLMWIEARARRPRIICTPRIGVDYAGADAALPWRMMIADSKWVSRPPQARIKK